MSIEKGGAIQYRDLVTILRLASMKCTYITKLAMLQSLKPRSPDFVHRIPVFRIRIRIHMFLGLPDPNPLVRGLDPDPNPSIILQK
jgi:hypothetical protein